MEIPEHPVIRSIETTGYPRQVKDSEPITCWWCGREMADDDFAVDYDRVLTCEDCLIKQLREDYTIQEIAEQFGFAGKTAAEVAAEMEERDE